LEVAVLFKSPLCGDCCLSTSFHSFPVILSRLESTHQDLSGDVKVVDRGQELVELHLSKVGLFLQAPKAYSPRPPKEIVAHRHYSPAKFVEHCIVYVGFPLGKCSATRSPPIHMVHKIIVQDNCQVVGLIASPLSVPYG